MVPLLKAIVWELCRRFFRSVLSFCKIKAKFFWRYFISLVKSSYWSKFHVNIITGSGVMTIFFYKRLTRNPEIGNTTIWVLPNIWRLGRITDTKFSMNVSNEMLLNAAKCQGYSFYRSWVPTGEGKITPQGLGLKEMGPFRLVGIIQPSSAFLLSENFLSLLE